MNRSVVLSAGSVEVASRSSHQHPIVPAAKTVSPHSLGMKIRDLLRLLVADGWSLARTKGSHQQFRHPTKPGLVTIAGHPGDDLARGTLKSILKQAGLKS